MIDYTKLFDTLYFKKIKQSHLAEELNISRSTFTRMSKGEPVSIAILEKICLKLGVRIEEIVEIKPDINIVIDGVEAKRQKKLGQTFCIVYPYFFYLFIFFYF